MFVPFRAGTQIFSGRPCVEAGWRLCPSSGRASEMPLAVKSMEPQAAEGPPNSLNDASARLMAQATKRACSVRLVGATTSNWWACNLRSRSNGASGLRWSKFVDSGFGDFESCGKGMPRFSGEPTQLSESSFRIRLKMEQEKSIGEDEMKKTSRTSVAGFELARQVPVKAHGDLEIGSWQLELVA